MKNDYLIVEENLRCAMRFFGEATGSGEVRQLNGAVAMFSGLDYGVFNIALFTRRVIGDDRALEETLAEIAHYFKERTLRWSVWLCEDLLEPKTRRRERQVFFDFGLRPISHPPGMLAPCLPPPADRLPAIECIPVNDASTRATFGEITSVTFDIPTTVAKAVYTREEAWQGNYQGFIGLVAGRPVSIVAIVPAAEALGIYSLGTLPAFRRQGNGEALLRAAVAETRRRTGLERLVLQSTEAGYSMYKRLGFRDAAKFTVYLTR
ncbi:MAG: GNAT family N-acetyltransferase [Bryobacteraceae bacterium]